MPWRHNNGATVIAQKLRLPPIMLIVARSYNENHMEASLFSES